MSKSALPLCLCASLLSLSACHNDNGGNSAQPSQPAAAQKAAGGQTIAAALDQNSKFYQAAKAVGLDTALAGPGPYTVLVPSDQAWNNSPAGKITDLTKPESKAQVTAIIDNHILNGTMLTDDIGKAIDKGHGSAMLTTMAGGTLTATKRGGNIVFTDQGGDKATVTKADEKRSNGVVDEVDGVLMPSHGANGAAAPKKG
jgi:uncharacterized surface protein with fasciclin (FAS1) repeats